MKAEDLQLHELVTFEEGALSLHGRRLVLHDVHAFAQFRRDLVESMGPEGARRVLTRFGMFWGQADAAAMKRIFDWADVREWIMAGPRLHSLQGVARVGVRKLEFDERSGGFLMEVVWQNSGEAQEHLTELGRSDAPACWMLVGYASGYASFCLNREIYFVEQRCRAAGARSCLAVGRDLESWGEELKPHLPYFKSAGIRGKIEKLSEELKRKNRLLARERRRTRELEKYRAGTGAEVRSRSMQKVLDLADRVARFDSSVLITGETGVGKEVLARRIHANSARAKEGFVTVNCGALPETLLESELFGHARGAFTGAVRDRRGLFEEANRGTIFLDEVAELSPATQVKLLRALQEGEVVRLGENAPRKVDMRVIAATNRDLTAAIGEGAFREDLYYRLAVVEIEIPPLRRRPEDIPALARHFVTAIGRKLKAAGLTLDATCLDRVMAYPWPGNIRELENAMERAALMSVDGRILPEHLPPALLDPVRGIASGRDGAVLSLRELEERHIRRVLEIAGGKRARAARMLGISPVTLWRKLGARR